MHSCAVSNGGLDASPFASEILSTSHACQPTAMDIRRTAAKHAKSSQAADAAGAGPSHATAAQEPASDAPEAAHLQEDEAPQPLLLLSLPELLLANHVWPHLGPWAQAQLRATCRQLRAVADGLLGPELRTALKEEVSELPSGMAWGRGRTEIPVADPLPCCCAKELSFMGLILWFVEGVAGDADMKNEEDEENVRFTFDHLCLLLVARRS